MFQDMATLDMEETLLAGSLKAMKQGEIMQMVVPFTTNQFFR